MFISSCHCNPRCSEINFVIPVVVKSCGNYSNTSIGCHALGANTTRAVAIAHRGTHRTSGKFLFHASACDELMPSIHRTPPGPTRRQLPGHRPVGLPASRYSDPSGGASEGSGQLVPQSGPIGHNRGMSATPPDGTYSFETGGLRYTGRYTHGRKDGPWKVFYVSSGLLRFEMPYRADIWHGLSRQWSSGVKTTEGRYEQGKMTGEWNFWFDSGQLAAHGSYDDDDHKIGAWVYFDEDGTSLDYQEWSQKFSHWDWAYDDYSGFPRGENWPNPPAGAEVIPADESPVS
jgi:hypothetical protein